MLTNIFWWGPIIDLIFVQMKINNEKQNPIK